MNLKFTEVIRRYISIGYFDISKYSCKLSVQQEVSLEPTAEDWEVVAWIANNKLYYSNSMIMFEDSRICRHWCSVIYNGLNLYTFQFSSNDGSTTTISVPMLITDEQYFQYSTLYDMVLDLECYRVIQDFILKAYNTLQ